MDLVLLPGRDLMCRATFDFGTNLNTGPCTNLAGHSLLTFPSPPSITNPQASWAVECPVQQPGAKVDLGERLGDATVSVHWSIGRYKWNASCDSAASVQRDTG